MPSADLGIATVSFDIDYPNIVGEIELVIPDKIPKVGGKHLKLDSFSISLTNPQVTLPVNFEFFGGSITVGLDTTHCEVQVSGEVKLDVVVHKYHWHVGPIGISYMTPLSLPEPSWSVNPTTLDPSVLQTAINNTPQSQSASGSGPSPQNDDVTKAELAALFLFCGAPTFITDLIGMASTLDDNLTRAKLARAVKTQSALRDASSSGVVIGFGFGGTGGGGIGISGGAGIFFTTGGDYGYYGSAGVGLGVIAELSAGATALVYWPDAGQSAFDCFKGSNFFLSLDAGEVVAAGLTLSWPMDEVGGKVISNSPCGIGIVLGAGVGFPVNFFSGNSNTWVDLNPPNF